MDAISSFFSNIKDKLTNPFFGTLILVLLFQHWELWFAIFNFDEDSTLTDRIHIVQSYISQNVTIPSFLYDLLKTAGIMLAGYLIVVLTRSFVMWIEHYVMPNITKKIVSDNVVLKKLYTEAVNERDTNFNKYEEQRDKVREYSKLIDEQQVQINSKNISISDLNKQLINKDVASNERINKIENDYEEKIEYLQKNKENAERNLLSQKKQETVKYENIVTEFDNIFFTMETKDFYSNSIDKLPPIIINTVNELINTHRFSSFLGMYDTVEKSRLNVNLIPSYNSHIVEIFKNLGLFSSDSNEKFVEVSLLGKIIYEYRNIFNID